MDTTPLACTEAIPAIADALLRSSPTIDPALARHVAGCPRCRAGLLLVVRGLRTAEIEDRDEQLDIVCVRCQEDLAAFIDLERRDLQRAAARYPQVWWHLWTCAICAQTYDLTKRLLSAEEEGKLPPLAHLVRKPRSKPEPLLRIPLLRRALAASVPLRPMVARSSRRSQSGQQYVLYHKPARAAEASSSKVEVEEREHQRWRMTIRMAPPPQALAVITCGTFRSVALFNTDGVATVDDLPPYVLTDAQAPNMDIQVFPIEDED